MHTERELTVNMPDIIIKNEKQKTCKRIYVAISENRNVVQNEEERN